MKRDEYDKIKKFNGKIYNGFCYFDDVKTKVSEDDVVDMIKFAIEDRVQARISGNREKEEIEKIMNIIDSKIIPGLTYEMVEKHILLYGIYEFVDNTITKLAIEAFLNN